MEFVITEVQKSCRKMTDVQTSTIYLHTDPEGLYPWTKGKRRRGIADKPKPSKFRNTQPIKLLGRHSLSFLNRPEAKYVT
jgi:hypothetical protein